MGLLLRLCDSFCAADNMLGLFGILKEAATQVLALEHCRLWQVDRKRKVQRDDNRAFNGRKRTVMRPGFYTEVSNCPLSI